MSEPTRVHNKYENVARSPTARWEPPRHERTTALDDSMELTAEQAEIALTGLSEWAEPLCAKHLRAAARLASLHETAETVSRALAYLTDRLSWNCCSPLMEERLMALHHDIEVAHETYALCALRWAQRFKPHPFRTPQ